METDEIQDLLKSSDNIIDDIIIEMYPEYSLLNLEAKDDFWDNLSESERYEINAKKLKITGNAKYDYLTCFEPGRFENDLDLFKYDNFLQIDKDWWQFQKEASLESIEDMKNWIGTKDSNTTIEDYNKAFENWKKTYNKYETLCQGDWYRLLDKYDGGKFKYIEIVSAKWYIFFKMETYLTELQEKELPYTFKSNDVDDFIKIVNEHDPKKCYDAGGRELELDSLLKQLRYYENALPVIISDELKKYDDLTGSTFLVEYGYELDNFDPFSHFILFDEHTMENLNPKTFLDDFYSNKQDNKLLDEILNKIKKIVQADFYKIYMENTKQFNYEK